MKTPLREGLQWLLHEIRSRGHTSIEETPLFGSGTVVALAPHPDDPESSAILQRMLLNGGWSIQWVVLTSAWSGVRDEFAGPDRDTKSRVRRIEQTESAHMFGLAGDSLTFLDLRQTPEGELDDTTDSYSATAELLNTMSPRIVILPWGQDTNATHRLAYHWFERWLRVYQHPVVAFLSEDPKSVGFSPDLSVLFGEKSARWKASLLECHRSQTERNLATRGCTFSE